MVKGEAPDVRMVEVKHADPRTLLLATVDRLANLVELYAKIRGEIREPGMAILLSPDWLIVRRRILSALEPYPEARQAVADALMDAARESAA